MPHETTTHNDLVRVYESCKLAEQGVSLETYLADPDSVLRLHGQAEAPSSIAAGYRPLLPEQIQAMRGVWEEWDQRDSSAAEPGAQEPEAFPDEIRAPVREVPRARRPGLATRIYRFFLPLEAGACGSDEWSMQRLYQEAGRYLVRNWVMALLVATLAMGTRDEQFLWLGLMIWAAAHTIMGAIAYSVFRHRDRYIEGGEPD